MLFQLIGPMKFDTTFLAMEKPHVLVSPFMVFSVSVSYKFLTTNFTDEWFLSSMNPHVMNIRSFVSENFSTRSHWTLVW